MDVCGRSLQFSSIYNRLVTHVLCVIQEYFIEAAVDQKALMVLYLLHHLKFRRVLCFTNSVEATHR